MTQLIQMQDAQTGELLGQVGPCSRCGSLELWWTITGEVRCERCDDDAQSRSRQWLAKAIELRQQHARCLPRNTRRAAREQFDQSVRDCEARVFGAILDAAAGGLTDEEISTVTGLELNTSRARRVRLRDDSKIIDSGQRRLTASGRKAIVWVATN